MGDKKAQGFGAGFTVTVPPLFLFFCLYESGVQDSSSCITFIVGCDPQFGPAMLVTGEYYRVYAMGFPIFYPAAWQEIGRYGSGCCAA